MADIALPHPTRASSPPRDVAGYRNQAPGFDPRSGEGARRFGGRFNPPGSFPVLYLCSTRACAASELRRQATRQAMSVEGLLPRELWIVETHLDDVLDLTAQDALAALGIARHDLVRDDHEFTQGLGQHAQGLGYQAVCTPSATGIGDVFAVFLQNLGTAELHARLLEIWASAGDLDS